MRPFVRCALELLPERFAVCRLAEDASPPAWAALASSSRFLSVTRTDNELSIVAPQAAVPPAVPCERDYRAMRVRGKLAFDAVGVLVSLAEPLAEAGLSVFTISTYDTDYVLVRARDLEPALGALRQAGHEIMA
jgi:hypothetical protein